MLEMLANMQINAELQDRISQFQKELRSLGGQCHLAAGPVELSKIILEITLNANCKLAIIESQIDNDEIRSTLTKNGIDAIRVQDARATLEVLSRADVGITHADIAISQTATVIIKTARDEDRLASCLPRVHIAIVSTKRLVEKLTDATEYLKTNLQTNEPCVISFVSGPSRTSDIEMKQVLGVHGPHEVHVIFLEQ
jgi:L-lactate dehydrogenase complex protein LldG